MRLSVSERAAGPRLSRRQFLGALALPVLASACRTPPPYDEDLFELPGESAIALMHADSYGVDFADIIGRGLRELHVDVRGRRVLLKPNLVEYEPGTAINTHPLVVAGAAAALLSAGAARVVVAEGAGHRRDTEYLLTSTGLLDHLRDQRLRFIDLNLDDTRYVSLKSHFTGMDRIALPVELLDSDFIVSMPKLKTHHWAGLTCSMKNLFGVVPGAVYGWPKNLLHMKGIGASILDLNATVRPHLAIVDAVVGMEGDGPIMGSPRSLGFIGMSRDLVAIDATCARIVGLDPMRLPYLAVASTYLGNLKERRIAHLGEAPARYATRFDVIELFRGARLE